VVRGRVYKIYIMEGEDIYRERTVVESMGQHRYIYFGYADGIGTNPLTLREGGRGVLLKLATTLGTHPLTLVTTLGTCPLTLVTTLGTHPLTLVTTSVTTP
jgi:hypothetical protein